ncbi:MAG: SpoIID/LytB domain-containing protein [Bacillota bacterium]|jgi:stage II sporulation protein D
MPMVDKYKKLWPIGAVILALVIGGAIFAWTQMRTPRIPPEIARGERQVPVLRVYDVEAKQLRDMNFEDYVAGVLAGEMRNDWPEEALAAQAILARTFALKFIAEKDSRYEGAHISTDIEEAQAWNAAEVNDRIRRAVTETRGEVAIHRNRFINAWFHAHAGGETATAREGLNWKGREPPYIQSIDSPDSDQAPPDDANWTATFSKAQVAQAVRTLGQDPGTVDRVEVVKRGPSNRVTRLRVGRAEVPGADFRTAIGSTQLKSMRIQSIQVAGDQVTFRGSGYGHGVGMSQWGAFEMANRGTPARDIVQYYFNGIRIEKLWE